MDRELVRAVHWALLCIPLAVAPLEAFAAEAALDRTVLPIAEPKRPVYTELDARNVNPLTRFEVKAPAGAPNVLIVLIDDVGFGQTDAFGGEIHTPTLTRLSNTRIR